MKIKKFEFNMFPVNCYVLSDETGEAVVIDAGCFYPEEKQMLKEYLSDNNLTLKHQRSPVSREGFVKCYLASIPFPLGPFVTFHPPVLTLLYCQ